MSMYGGQETRKSHRQGGPSSAANMFDKSPMGKSPFLGTEHDNQQQLMEIGLLKTNFGEMWDRYYGFQTQAGKSADPRTLRLLEFFRQLYYRRQETFKKMVPAGLQEELVELFNKIGALLEQVKSKREVRTMQRSLSVGSPRHRLPGGSDLELDRFKVRTVQVDGGGSSGGGGSGGSDVKQIGQGGQGR